MVQRTTPPCPCPTINPPSACPSSSIHHQLIMFHWPKTRTEGEGLVPGLVPCEILKHSHCPTAQTTE